MNCPYPCSVRAMLIGCTGALTLWGRACMLHNLATRLRCLDNLWVMRRLLLRERTERFGATGPGPSVPNALTMPVQNANDPLMSGYVLLDRSCAVLLFLF
jgi:hypothetical protein